MPAAPLRPLALWFLGLGALALLRAALAAARHGALRPTDTAWLLGGLLLLALAAWLARRRR